MPKYITRNCPVCNKEYEANPARLKINRDIACSRECSYKYRVNKRPKVEKETRICANCSNPVTRYSWGFTHEETFCNLECYHAHRAKQSGYDKKPADKQCPICGNVFKLINRKNNYCSRKCFEISHKTRMSGEGNPSYIDGRGKNHTYDAGSKWHEIRRDVYKRDNYSCQICGVKCVSKKEAMKDSQKSHLIIQCHHINPYKQSKDNSLDNLVTLCIVCHRGVHDGKHKIRLETIRKNQLKLF